MSKDYKKIAIDYYDGKIFSSDMIRKDDLGKLGMIFMPIMLGAFADKTEEEQKEIYFIYEYYDQALSRGINGYPLFSSFRYLTKKECDIVNIHFEEYKKLKEGFING